MDLFLGDLDLLGVLDLLGGVLDLLDPLYDRDLSLGRNLGEADLEPRLRGEDLGDNGLLEPDDVKEVLS